MIHPLELLRYRIVVTSYSHLHVEFTRILKFKKAIKEYPKLPKERRGRHPGRPSLSLLSGLFLDGLARLGRLLVLDEAHTIKNTDSCTYAAVALLRRQFEACIMLTGTPLDNTWIDAFALFNLLSGHRIRTMTNMREAFTDPADNMPNRQARIPKVHYFTRLVQMMDACTLRRPLKTVQHMLTDLTVELAQFELPGEELKASNDKFRKFWNLFYAGHGNQGSEQAAMTGRRRKKQRMTGFLSFIKAQQMANHPMLIEITRLEKRVWISAIEQEDAADLEQVGQKAQRLLEQWREPLSQNRNWRSARVDKIIDIINRHRDVYQDDVYVIMDESVYFLDIIKIALGHTDDPIPSYTHDVREDPVERDLVLENFQAASGPRALLVSHGTGGVGLNLQCANVLVQCGPSWKQSWEEQAVGRIHRPGQTKPVFVYKIQAHACKVEKHKVKWRDQNQRVQTRIVNAITRVDDAQVPQARECS